MQDFHKAMEDILKCLVEEGGYCLEKSQINLKSIMTSTTTFQICLQL